MPLLCSRAMENPRPPQKTSQTAKSLLLIFSVCRVTRRRVSHAKAESRMRVFSNMAATWPSKLYLTGGLSYLTTGHTIAIARRLAVGKGS